MDGTSNRHLLDEKDPGTTGGYSTSSAPRSEKDFAYEATPVTQDQKLPPSDFTAEPTPGCEDKSSDETTQTAAAGVAAQARNEAEHHEAAGPVLSGWRLGLLGLGLCLGLFLAMLDTSIVATCLYAIALEFNSLESINWVALSYTLTYLGCSVLFARVSDVIGRKAAFVAAFVIFIAFSLGCGFAQNMDQLVVFRALQGVGGSGLYSIAIILFPELVPDNKMKLISGLIGIVIAVAGVLGPVVGGLLTHYRSWRYVFWINGPIGGFSLVVFWLSWPRKEYQPHFKRRAWKDLDYPGSMLLIAASVLTVFSFQNASVDADQWSQPVFIVPLVLGIFSLIALFAWEYFIERRWRGEKAAAFPLSLLRNHVYSAGMLNTMFLGFPYFVVIYSFPIRFQIVNGKSALMAGIMLLPMLAGTALGSWLGGLINTKKNRIFEVLLVSCALMILGCALETTASDSQHIEAKVLGFTAFIGFGFGLSAAGATMLASLESTIRDHAPAQGIIAQVRILGGSLGIASSSAILGVKTRSELATVLSPAQMGNLAEAVSSLTAAEYAAVRRTYTDSLRLDMIVCCAVLGAGFLTSLGAYRRNRTTIGEQQRQRYIEEREYQRALAAPVAQDPEARASA